MQLVGSITEKGLAYKFVEVYEFGKPCFSVDSFLSFLVTSEGLCAQPISTYFT